MSSDLVTNGFWNAVTGITMKSRGAGDYLKFNPDIHSYALTKVGTGYQPGEDGYNPVHDWLVMDDGIVIGAFFEGLRRYGIPGSPRFPTEAEWEYALGGGMGLSIIGGSTQNRFGMAPPIEQLGSMVMERLGYDIIRGATTRLAQRSINSQTPVVGMYLVLRAEPVTENDLTSFDLPVSGHGDRPFFPRTIFPLILEVWNAAYLKEGLAGHFEQARSLAAKHGDPNLLPAIFREK